MSIDNDLPEKLDWTQFQKDQHGDVEAFFNMRSWLSKAVEKSGAKVHGAGIGMGQADIDIELEGARFNISIRPIMKS